MASRKKIIISGYYGFDNFGDDAILRVLVSDISRKINADDITVISNNPQKIKENYGINSLYKFDFKAIFKEMSNAHLFISGGGSLLQDVTSVKSLLYYLFLIFTAQIKGLKTYIYAQGIGPITSAIGKTFTSLLLKRATEVTVRDENSFKFLKSLNVNSIKTADPVWGIKKPETNKLILQKNITNIGIQLREWKSLDTKKLEILAKVINENFSNSEQYKVNLISLQDTKDLPVAEELLTILTAVNPSLQVNLLSKLSINDALDVFGQLDYLIAMRLHAALVSIKFNIPTIALSYDPKVEILSEESGIPYVKIENMNFDEINSKVSEVITNKDLYVEKLKEYSNKKLEESRQNIELLIKMILSK